MFVFLLIALIFFFFSLGKQFLFLPAICNFPLAFLQWCSPPWASGVCSVWRADSFLGVRLPRKFSQVLRALRVTEVITGLSSLIICVGKSLLLQKELWKRERYLNVTDMNFCIYLCKCTFMTYVCIFMCVCLMYIYTVVAAVTKCCFRWSTYW